MGQKASVLYIMYISLEGKDSQSAIPILAAEYYSLERAFTTLCPTKPDEVRDSRHHTYEKATESTSNNLYHTLEAVNLDPVGDWSSDEDRNNMAFTSIEDMATPIAQDEFGLEDDVIFNMIRMHYVLCVSPSF